jgi:hypothetical protein
MAINRLYFRLSAYILLTLCSFELSAQKVEISSIYTYQRHTEIYWRKSTIANVRYVVHQYVNGTLAQSINVNNDTTALIFSDANTPQQFQWVIEELNVANQVIAKSDTLTTQERIMSDNEMMDMVQRYTFRYFWDDAHPTSGMARERNSSGDVVTSGGTGFGVMAILAAVENGYITRSQASSRMIKILSFLQFADRYHGVFPHWMNGKTGDVIPFSQYDNGGDLVETAFLMQGLLCARTFFDAEQGIEKSIRNIITKLYEEVEWDWYTRNNSGSLYWHWSPNHGWTMNFPLRGYNETMIAYILAVASPTHGIAPSYWTSGWAKPGYVNGNSWYGHKLFVGPAYGGPLFFAHYSFLGFDPRDKKDKYCNYFNQNKNHTLINRGYCIQNPMNHSGYSATCWGLTASDTQGGYAAHAPGAPDNGTIAPTAALSSMPYTPMESLAALRHFYLNLGDKIWGKNGFYDAFNQRKNWYADSYLAIDQGPIIVMIQNYRTELLWKLFMANPEINPALSAIGFVQDLSDTQEPIDSPLLAPIPSVTVVNQKMELPTSIHPNATYQWVHLSGHVYQQGRCVEEINTPSAPGLYFLSIMDGQNIASKKILVLSQ